MRLRSSLFSLAVLLLLSVGPAASAAPRDRGIPSLQRPVDPIVRFVKSVKRLFRVVTSGDNMIPPTPTKP